MAKTDTDQIPTLIVCIDATNVSESSLLYACHIAKKNHYNVKIFSVVEQSHQNLLFGSKAIGTEKRKFVENKLAKLLKKAFDETKIMPFISVREGDIVKEIKKELEVTPKCPMIIFGKSDNAQSDNVILPKLAKKIGNNKIKVPITIVPSNLPDEFYKNLI
ncbi:MAG: universal stress protein [Rickettsiales bacterium]|nr:universal stress protein [Rickettsiales bacterium]